MKKNNRLALLIVLSILLICLVLLVFKKLTDEQNTHVTQKVHPAPLTLNGHNWHIVRDISGVQVYMKSTHSSAIKSFLGKTILQNHDLYSIAAVFEDFANSPQWMHMISDFSEINRLSNHDRQVHLRTRLPWPLTSRDTVMNINITQDPTNYDLNIIMEKNDSLLPELPGYMRISEIHGRFRAKMLSNQKIALEFEFVFNPGGHTPIFLSNMMMKNIPFYSLKKLKRMLIKEEYQNKQPIYESWIKIPPNYTHSNYFHPDEISSTSRRLLNND